MDLLPGEEDESKKVREFIQLHYKERPRERLAPRVALRGGKVECFGVKFEAKDDPTFRIVLLDYNSL